MRISNIAVNTAIGVNQKINHNQKADNIIQSRVNNTHSFFDSQKIIAFNNVSFHGIFGFDKRGESTTEEKLNAAIQNLDNRSIVLFAENFDSAKNLLNINLNHISFPIENIYFVKNDFNMDSFAVYKDAKDDKYKIFKLHPLSMVKLLTGGTDEWDTNVKRDFVQTADEPIELRDGQNIQFGLSKKDENTFKIDLSKNNLRFVFDRDVKKYRYFDDEENAQKFNASRLMALNDNPKKVSKTKKLMFVDIGAQDENIKALEENVIFPLKFPEFFEGFRINKGILLYGPPRCGKTMLAQALANEAGVNFIKLGANDLTHSHVGKTEQNWRELFKTAIENQPTIIFIDEFDSISRERGGSSDAARYQDDVVNQLLTLMSDLEKSDDKVFIIAATNREDLLDKALLNTGRFGLRLEVKPPDLNGTKQIYNIHQKNKPLDKDIDKEKLCEIMYENHFNGSDIAETFYIAHSFAMKRLGIFEKMRNRTVTNKDKDDFKIIQQDMEKAIEKLAGQKSVK